MTDSTRYALVTGSASGLGRAISLRLAREGWTLALADIDELANAATLQQVLAAGGRGTCFRLDVTDFAAWQALVGRLQTEWPRLDMLVNNAGVATSGEVSQTSIDDWRWLLGVNLQGVLNGCHATLDWLKANPGRASLVNIASLAAVMQAPAMGAYNVSKAGVLALSETLATELRGSRVRLTVACPGFFATELIERGRFPDARLRAQAEWYMQHSATTAERVADRVVRAALRGQLYVFTPLRARMLWYVKRCLPTLWNYLLGIAYQRLQK